MILFFSVLLAVCLCTVSEVGELLVWMVALACKAFNWDVNVYERRKGEVTL